MGFELEDFMPQETMTAILDEIDRVYGSDLSHEIAYSLGQDGWVSEQLRKKAEADPKLSTWNRLRIINECNSALLELHLQ